MYDPDACENGTIKSIDLTLINLQRPSRQVFMQRKSKYEILKKNLKSPLNLNIDWTLIYSK